MFNCEFCKKPSKHGEPRTMIVVETRPKTYHDDRGVAVGQGLETVKEYAACPACAPKISRQKTA